jgi:hypothetical protein
MKCSLSNIEGLSAEIENLRTLSTEGLDQTWRDLFESDRPRRVCGDLLIKALGYRLQEKAIGGLIPSTRRLLERWGRNRSEQGPLAQQARTRLKTGTVLVREWHGVTHRVAVLDDGFDFHGERFRSLSEIARKITGVRWSGPLFFGLKSFARGQRHGVLDSEQMRIFDAEKKRILKTEDSLAERGEFELSGDFVSGQYAI